MLHNHSLITTVHHSVVIVHITIHHVRTIIDTNITVQVIFICDSLERRVIKRYGVINCITGIANIRHPIIALTIIYVHVIMKRRLTKWYSSIVRLIPWHHHHHSSYTPSSSIYHRKISIGNIGVSISQVPTSHLYVKIHHVIPILIMIIVAIHIIIINHTKAIVINHHKTTIIIHDAISGTITITITITYWCCSFTSSSSRRSVAFTVVVNNTTMQSHSAVKVCFVITCFPTPHQSHAGYNAREALDHDSTLKPRWLGR
mmetsp:Transcript_15712/g.28112  ORF Transcript_15712/g.28112 Transcript_15712/m.28112 type:complete len:259 (+) Transcript_15712:381-1157(+)